MAINCDIWLGDLVRAIRQLKPTDERSIAEIAGLLGFNFRGSEKLMSSSPSTPVLENAEKLEPTAEFVEKIQPVLNSIKSQDLNNLLENKEKDLIYAIPSENILILLHSRKS